MVTSQQQEVREKLNQLASKHQCFNKEKPQRRQSMRLSTTEYVKHKYTVSITSNYDKGNLGFSCLIQLRNKGIIP